MSIRPTKVLSGEKALEAIHKGINAIFLPVSKTFGPEGKNGLIYRTLNRGNRISNDGVTLAESIEPRDQFIRMAAQTFKESCKKTNEKVGDGTTCTTIIGGELFNSVYKKLDSGNSVIGGNKTGVMTLKKEILESAKKVKELIKKSSKQIKSLKDLEKVAIISVEDEELGKIIAKMAYDVGIDGFIDVVEGYKGGIETEVIKGMRCPAKVPAKAFVNNPARYEMTAEDCPILITNHAMDNVGSFAQSFNDIQKSTSKLVVLAPSFSENVLVNFVNANKNGYFIKPVKVPTLRTEQYEDLAIYCGSTFIDKAKGKKLSSVTAQDLGFIEKIVVKDTEAKEDAIITGGQGTKIIESPLSVNSVGYEKKEDKTKSAVEERIETLKGQLAETKQEMFKKLMERRIASMASAVGVVKVGGSTEAESLYKKLKIEDAVYACKSALRGGYVKGGGICLKEIADKLPEDDILKSVITAPHDIIKETVDKIGENVFDPTEAIYYAVEHATQVVSNLLTVNTMVVEVEQNLPEEGSFEIAKMLKEYVISDKINKGQLKAGEAEAYKDSLGGMTEEEFSYSQND
jgi:chaperonin GroEL